MAETPASEPAPDRGAADSPKPWVEGSTLGAGVLVVLVLYGMVNYLSTRHYERFDWTGSKLYTLSQKSKNVLAELDRDIDLVVLMNPGSEVYTATDELLDRYVAANPQRIRRRDLDAAKDLLELQRLAEQYGIERDNVIVVASGGDRRVIDELELADYDYSGAQYGQPPALEAFKGEPLITGAILALAEADKPRILFTTGHGEAPLDPGDPRSLSQARDLLGRDNFEIDTWSSLGQGRVPEGTDLLVIAGPTSSFLEPELEAIGAFLDGGGRALLMLDPAFVPGTDTLSDLGLGPWLRGFGVEIRPDLVLDTAAAVPFYGPETFYTQTFGSHPVVEAHQGGGLPVIWTAARSVAAAAGTPGAVELAITTGDGWGETDLQGDGGVAFDADVDLAGPVPVAVAVARPADDGAPEAEGSEASGEDSAGDGTRLVVIGDLDFATDLHLAGNRGNTLLFLNAFNWLVEREQLIDIEPRRPEATRLGLDRGELGSLVALVLLVMPGAAVIAGVWIALRRRRF
ncbi:MAG: GldG family protein [Acidobacteriota bacterium]